MSSEIRGIIFQALETVLRIKACLCKFVTILVIVKYERDTIRFKKKNCS